jgi:hypothetical protein
MKVTEHELDFHHIAHCIGRDGSASSEVGLERDDEICIRAV